METGAITSYIDVAQVVLYAFWIFFAGLIYYLHQEDKREGYPLLSDRSDRVVVQGFPPIPAPKVFTLRDGSKYSAPPGNPDDREINAVPVRPLARSAAGPDRQSDDRRRRPGILRAARATNPN